MIDLSRRRFFGLLAAPAIISITGKLQPALIVPAEPELWVTPPPASRGMNVDAFRAIVEPGLREFFAAAFSEDYAKAAIEDYHHERKTAGGILARTLIVPRGQHEYGTIRRQLRGLPAGRPHARR